MSEDVIPKPVKGDGDWTCADEECANLNFARRTSCNRCGKEKPDSSSASKKQIGVEIGKAAAEKSRGLFSAEDWQCTKCGNVNWARRYQCNMCNAPKFGDVEERTGYGGGYNDRGVVEYISREESDEEYDEFGRKRKKFKGSPESEFSNEEARKEKQTETYRHDKVKVPDKASSVLEASPRRDADEDEEEEDEDEEDEEDLSKYDLTNWGDEDDDSTKTKRAIDEGKANL